MEKVKKKIPYGINGLFEMPEIALKTGIEFLTISRLTILYACIAENLANQLGNFVPILEIVAYALSPAVPLFFGRCKIIPPQAIVFGLEIIMGFAHRFNQVYAKVSEILP